ncbi:antibiotic biosynthesis monooxygenase [bacterium]|nr:antibiotic biosynthesis monooxygenase [bacterium]MCI0612663.1 antibiotic biosynthesis monooxygenase [bacterium]
MFARIVHMKLKKDAEAQFAKIFETEVVPVLAKQEGFRHSLTLSAKERSEVTGITFWSKRQNAENYNSTVYPEVLKSLSSVIDGTPEVKTFVVTSSTLRKNPAGQTT